MWEPIEEHCRALGERFRFINAPRLDGYKAGALRLAMAQTAADAEIIGIIDADYAVTPDWLSDLVPAFADPKVGLIQAPQDHRDGERSPLHHVMNGEYAGFFDIGMVQRNEVNAIIVHGTMCLIRRAAMDSAGGWSSDTICEDTDLGLTLLEQGWVTHYTNRRYGRGLLPDTFEAYKKQRDRWASGGFQIVAQALARLPARREPAHARPEARVRVRLDQLARRRERRRAGRDLQPRLGAGGRVRRHRGAGQGADPADHRDLRDLGHSLHRALQAAGADPARAGDRRDDRGHGDAVDGGARGRELHHQGSPDLRAHRQGRQGQARRRVAFPAFNEAILGGLLVLGALIVFQTNYERVQEINLFGYVLLVQSLPFLAAVVLAAFEGSRINDFALWAALEAKLVELLPSELLPRRNRVTETAAAPEKQMEAAP